MTFREQNKLKALTFSYDDAVTQDIRLIELMNRYDLKGTFNLNSECLGSRGMLVCNDQRVSHYKLHPEDVKTVYEGHEVAAHTLTHPNLTQLPDEEVIRQVEQDRQNLSELVGYDVVGLAYPCGGVNHDERTAELIRQHTGIRYCRTIISTDTFVPPPDLHRLNPSAYHLNFEKLMELGRRFVESTPDTPQIFYVWGHSYELDLGIDYWEKLEEFFKLISHREDVFYGTNRQVLL